MGHFVRTKKVFNAYLDRLVNLDMTEQDELQSEEHPNDNSISSQDLMNNLKSDKFN